MHVLMATKLLPSPMQLYLMQWGYLDIEAHLRIKMDVDEGRGRGDVYTNWTMSVKNRKLQERHQRFFLIVLKETV